MTEHNRVSRDELEAEVGTQLPDKEVVSLLDLFVNIDLALDLAAPVDLAVAANANAAAPIDAAVTANILSTGSTAQALSSQAVMIDQHLDADAIAHAPQDASIDQSDDTIGGAAADTQPAAQDQVVDPGATTADTGTAATTAGGTDSTAGGSTAGTGGVTGAVDDAAGDATDGATDGATDVVSGVTQGGLLDDGLLNVNVDVKLDADMAAPIAGAVAANANVAAPIDGSVSANIASVDSTSVAVADQTALISQNIEGSTAEATAAQDAEITQ
ncbi:MAG TPA: hypothetical protein VFG63_03155 [Nocardioidaceae bacterium]|nr:hypothetical protein [Nocardioidaceae bacterium]